MDRAVEEDPAALASVYGFTLTPGGCGGYSTSLSLKGLSRSELFLHLTLNVQPLMYLKTIQTCFDVPDVIKTSGTQDNT